MRKDTLFHILSRQPWWVTLLVAFVMFWIAYAIFPRVAPFISIPFVALAGYIGFRQWREGSPADAGDQLARMRAMSWDEFSRALTAAYRKQGYTVLPPDGAGHDFKLVRNGQSILLQCRRWKVNQVGEGPLRELARALHNHDAARGICVAAGDFSARARRFAANEPITLLTGAELAQLMR